MFENAGLGELFSVLCAMSWALAVVLFRRSGESLPPFELNLFKNVLGLALLIPTAFLMEGALLPGYSPSEWVIVLVSGFIGIALADTWYLTALRMLGAGRTGIVATLYSPFVITLSVIFLGESLSAIQILGFGFVMTGILLVTWRQHREDIPPRQLRIGLLFGAGSVLLMAGGIVMVKRILEQHEFFWTVQWRMFGGVLGMLIFASLRREWKPIVANFKQPQPWLTIGFASFLSAYLSLLFWLAGYKLTKASIASMLNESAAAFIVLFAFLILKEPLHGRKLLGLACTLGGVLLVLSA